MSKSLNILIIGADEAGLARLARDLPVHGVESRLRCVPDGAAAIAASSTEDWDIVLVADPISGATFRETLTHLRTYQPDLPVILATHGVDEETAVDLVRQGVWDIVRVDKLARLAPAIERALREKDAGRARQASAYACCDRFDSLSDAIYIQDEQGRFLEVNQGAVEMYGYPRADFIGRTPEFLAAPGMNDLASLPDLIHKAFSGEEQRLEFWGRRANGEVFPKEVRLARTHFMGRQAVIAVARDVSERKQVEQRLAEQNALLQTILESLPLRVFWKDRESRYLGCNTLFARDAGASAPADVIGKNDFQLAWREQAERYQRDDHRVMACGEAKLGYEEPQSTPDGQRIWLRTSKVPLRGLSGDTLGVLGLYEDVSGQKATEERSRLRQAALVAAANAVVITDGAGQIVWANPAFTTLTGYALDEALGRTPGELLRSGKHDQAYYETLWRAILAGQVWHGEITNRRKDGTLFEEEMTITPVPDEDGRIRHFVAVKQDIGERKRLQRRERMRLDILEKIARAAPLPEVLDALVRAVEEEAPDALCSILLLDETGRHLVHGAAASLPDFYVQAINGVEIGHGVGSCGTAAQEGRRVIVEDIQTHPYWAPYKALAAQAGLAACWSEPILGNQGNVLGTFAMYKRTPGGPSAAEIELIAQSARLAHIAIERLRTQQALVREVAQRRLLLDQSRDGIVVLGEDGAVREANQAFADMLGHSLDEVLQLHVWDWDAMWTREQLEAALRQVDAAGDHYETRHRRKDGTLYDVEISTNGAMWEGGKRVFCVCRDITARKAAAAALRASEERFDLAMRGANDGLWDWNLETNAVYYSPRWKAMLGYADEELENHFNSWERLVDAAGREHALTLIDACLAGRQEGFTTEFRMRHKDGHWVDILSRALLVRDAGGKAARMVGTHVDISERKRLEQRLRDSEAQANLIIDTAPDAIIVSGADGRIVRVNPSAEAMFGYAQGELLGQLVDVLLPDRLRHQHVAHRASFMVKPARRSVQERPESPRLLGLRKDGGEFALEAGLSPILLDGQPFVVATLRDITARKVAEETMRLDREQQSSLRELLENVLRGGSQEAVLARCLARLLAVSWLSQRPRGGIFLAPEAGGSPRLAVSQGWSPRDGEACERLLLDYLRACDQAAPSVGAYPMAGAQEGEERGYYCLPLVSDGRMLGVLVLYLSAALTRAEGKEQFLVSVASILAGFLNRKQAERALMAHQEGLERTVAERTSLIQRQARIIDQSHDSVVTTDLDGHVTSWNRGAEQLFGVPAAQAMGRHISFVYPPEERDFLHHQIIEALKAKGQLEVEARMWRADHAPFHAHLSLSLLRDDAGAPTGMVGYSLDISERKRMEDALREREADLAHAQAITHMGSWRLDIARNVLTWSEETYRIFGITPGTQVGLGDFIGRLHPEDTEQVLAAWTAAMAGEPYDIEHRIVVGDEVKWVREQAELQFDADRQPILGMGSVQDISAFKAAQFATQRALEEAERLARLKSEFLANMSHEIRTPMNAVLGLAQIGLRENHGRESGKTCGRILEAGQHLLGVINDILDYSKIESGKLGIEAHAFQLDATLQAAVDMVAERAHAKGLALNVSRAADLPHWVTGDPLRLKQILVNLLANAVKFTEGGEVVLRVAREGNETWFKVIDTGLGMDAEQLSRLFRPFEQADGSTTRKFGGTGLGLAISRNLANLMGGEITVESVAGAGSAFTLRLPLAASRAPADAWEATPATQAGPRLAHVRVLAAEDVEVNRLILEDLLVTEGAQVIFAENGQQALERLEEAGVAGIDVVLMDVQMPVMDGHEATRRIHALAPELPVIGLTAHALAEERERCLDSGMVSHVTKPIDADELVDAIRRNLGLQEGARD